MLEMIAKTRYPERFTLTNESLTYNLSCGEKIVSLTHTFSEDGYEDFSELPNQLEWSVFMAAREHGYPELLSEDDLALLESESWLETPDGTVECVNRVRLQKQIAELGLDCIVEEKRRPVVVHFASHDLVIPEGTTKKDIAVLLIEAASK
jgi:hypothetical protein